MNPKQNPYAKAAGAKAGGSYSNSPQPGNPTYTEAWALIEAARRMAVAVEFGTDGSLKNRNKMREALQLNWRLWTLFQSSLTVGDAVVPEEVRLNILTLAKFIDKHTPAALQEPTPERIATLIDINRNIGSGLLESLEGAVNGSELPQPEPTAPAAVDMTG